MAHGSATTPEQKPITRRNVLCRQRTACRSIPRRDVQHSRGLARTCVQVQRYEVDVMVGKAGPRPGSMARRYNSARLSPSVHNSQSARAQIGTVAKSTNNIRILLDHPRVTHSRLRRADTVAAMAGSRGREVSEEMVDHPGKGHLEGDTEAGSGRSGRG